MKYVRHASKGFFLFPNSNTVLHSDVGAFLGRGDILSAGFVMFIRGVPRCYGRSESLDIDGRDDDTSALLEQIQG